MYDQVGHDCGDDENEPGVPDLHTILNERFAGAIGAAVGREHAETDPLINASSNAKFGDYQANVAMGLAKRLGRKPRDVAQAIVDELDLSGVCQTVELAGPAFINLTLSGEFLSQQIEAMAADVRLGIVSADPAHTVVVDYSGPNMAKEMHIGHIRSSCIGDCLVRVFEAGGHRVIRQNHLGDWGTQFGMLVEHLVESGWDRAADHTISDLDELYRQSKQRFDTEPEFADRARRRVVTLQSGDEQTLAYWRMLINESIRHMNGIYRRLGLRLSDDDIRAESFYNPMLPQALEELDKAGLLKQSRGAKVVLPDGFADRDGEPMGMIVQKADGGYLYATTDLAAVLLRIRQLQADRIIYVTDPRQSQHFAMLFATVRKARWADDSVRLDHVPFGTILGADRRPFKTREGGTVKLADVLDEAEQRAAAVINQKNPDLPADQREQIAHVVAVGALKYADLSSDRIKDYVFDWDRMLALDGNTAPYLQNAYVRIHSIFRKGQIEPDDLAGVSIQVADPAERAMAIKLLQLPSAVAAVADSLEPHRLCTYLYELAASFHQFYEACPVLNPPDAATRDSRLRLCDLTARTLRFGLGLLGIDVVEQM